MSKRSSASLRERDVRGNTRDRAARRTWIVSPFAGQFVRGVWTLFGGDGEKVPCWHCHAIVCKADVEIDRIIPGGSYRRENIQPSCRSCNLARSDNPSWTP